MAKRVRVSGYARVRRVGASVVVTQVKPYRRSPPKQEEPMSTNDRTDRRLPILNPGHIQNIVLHPGDTIATGAYAGDHAVNYVRILDRHGVCFAVLDCERDVAGHGWLINNIRFVADYLTATGAKQTPPAHEN
jgi:hypothetical protein